ncbi:MAG TPA: UDP-glucose/GDP-mannose dehydrogenase family protein [Dehalococcoidia bacterium]|jgi:UDPglucose 6-dehydrogenase|nr:UDP-glucose/GDP-mannose dehydrogenase family protein [Dehalococcoidia bacterium]
MGVSSKKTISVIGLGYVGLTTAVGFGLKGYKIIGVDLDKEVIAKINRGLSPIYEEGMEEALQDVEVTATLDYGEVLGSDISFLCVHTPANSDGSVNLDYLRGAVLQLVDTLQAKEGPHLMVIRSTVVPGTTEGVLLPLIKDRPNLQICVNPEFLREGKALNDFMNPSRIIIGENNAQAGDWLYEMYQSFNCPILRTDLKTAEMIKYASNAFLATRISFINELGNICKKLGIDIYRVAEGMGHDERIGKSYLAAGIGFGGSCLSKDLEALMAQSRSLGYEPGILREVHRLNQEQPRRLIELLKKHLSPKGKTVGILGLAFKPGTDDVRESRAIPVVEALLQEEARIKAYDPKAIPHFKRLFPRIEYATLEEVLKSDAIIILTEWPEFERVDYKGKVVIDGRRLSKAKEASVYEGICW